MSNRREFLKDAASAAAGMVFTGCSLLKAAQQSGAPRRRQVVLGSQRVKTIDVHAHCAIPAAAKLVNRDVTGQDAALEDRLKAMDAEGIDMQALSINPFWYDEADREVATKLIQMQNEGLAALCAEHPDRFVAFASVALQFPDLAAQQLEEGVKKLGLRGAAIAGHVNGDELSNPKFNPFWAKAEELGVLVFMHPGGADNVIKMGGLEGKGDLGNIIGNPLETTLFFTQLIFNGTLDKFPGLKICGAHGGGYLPSYLGRTEVACDVRANAKCVNKKKPDEYFHQQLLADSMVFSPEGVRHLVAELGPSQVVYGTDIPLVWPDTIDAILGAQIPDAQKEAVLGGNLVKLLKIS
jgi:aminocarboxymuconate-semialdehyde decarboxylase